MGGLNAFFVGIETCFGWDPRRQTTGARVLVGTPGTQGAAIRYQNTSRIQIWLHVAFGFDFVSVIE